VTALDRSVIFLLWTCHTSTAPLFIVSSYRNYGAGSNMLVFGCYWIKGRGATGRKFGDSVTFQNFIAGKVLYVNRMRDIKYRKHRDTRTITFESRTDFPILFLLFHKVTERGNCPIFYTYIPFVIKPVSLLECSLQFRCVFYGKVWLDSNKRMQKSKWCNQHVAW
jgi:hypothetical protein